MGANHNFILNFLKNNFASGLILDYGCGSGDVVQAGNNIGLKIIGVDAFYGGSNAKRIADDRGLLGSKVFPLGESFEIPLSDASVDFVFSNMVLEHVDDIDLTLKEINRVLKPGGSSLHLFPSIEVIREGHCGIPLVHWFEKNSKMRRRYTKAMRYFGFGNFKSDKNVDVWVDDFLSWIDQFCRYRSQKEVFTSFRLAGFHVAPLEHDYINYRLKLIGINMGYFMKSGVWKVISRTFCRRFGSMVIVANKID